MATETEVRRQVEFPTHERPNTDISTMAMLGIAAGFVALWFGVLYLTPPTKGNFIRDLFMGADVRMDAAGHITEIVHGFLIERLIFQGAITLVWALSAATVVLKMLRLKTERESIDEDLVPEGTDFTDMEKVNGIYDKVKSDAGMADSLGLTRIARVLAMWINTGDFERTSEYAHNQADMDAMASDSSFRRNRLFIWAMPLLGFVGTVFGVAAGIGGFATFLKQANVTPDQIKDQVGEITTGLAVAFYCTLLGLLTAGLAAFPSLMAERKEEEVLVEIDEFVEDRLLSHMPSGGVVQAQAAAQKFPIEELVGAIREGMEGLQTQAKFPVEELAQAIDAGFRRLPNPERYEEVFSKAVAKAGEVINTKYEEFQTNYERRVGELGSTLGSKLESVSTNFTAGTTRMMSDFTKAQDKTLEQFTKNDAKLTEHFEELTESVTKMGKEISEQIGESHERYVEAVEDLDKKEIQRWEKMVGDFNQLSVKIADSFKQSVATLDSASGRYADRIQQSVEKLTEQLEKITQLGNEIDKVLRTTQSMEATLRQVGSSDEFRQTLANIRNHLVASDELLKQLSKPRKVVFQEARSEE
jgi:biopolymer transport protein ExbB/TolQ